MSCSSWVRGWAVSVFQRLNRSAPAAQWARASSHCLSVSQCTCCRCRPSSAGCRACSPSNAPATLRSASQCTPRHPRRRRAVAVSILVLLVVVVFFVVILSNTCIVIIVRRSRQCLLRQDYLSGAFHPKPPLLTPYSFLNSFGTLQVDFDKFLTNRNVFRVLSIILLADILTRCAKLSQRKENVQHTKL